MHLILRQRGVREAVARLERHTQKARQAHLGRIAASLKIRRRASTAGPNP